MSLSFGFMAPSNPNKLLNIAPTLTEYGYSWVEVTSPGRSKKLEQVLAKLQAEYGFQVSVHSRFLGVNLSVPNPTMRKAAVKVLCQDIEFCLRVGARTLVIHGGETGWCDVLPPQHPAYDKFNDIAARFREKSLAALNQSMVDVVERFDKAPITLAIENLYFPWELLLTPEEMAHFIADTRLSRLSVTLDMGHLRVVGYQPLEFLDAVGTRLRHVHIHGNDGLYDLHDPLTELPKGWAEALKRMNDLPYDLPVIMEWQDSHLINYLNSKNLCS
jgi:sugar phosphate isomerase/epimerase